MNQTFASNSASAGLLDRFGSAEERVTRAVEAIRQGGGVVVVDDEDRENEGDVIYAAETITAEQMALLIREGSGIVCLILTDADARRLDLPPMVGSNTARFGTAFTVSIEAREGVSTGVSAADRVTTIRTAIADGCRPEDLARPGHVFPIRAHAGGLAARRGHTEATIELTTLAGRRPAGVLCEVMNPDGTMARLPELVAFAERQGMPVVTIEDLVGAMRLRAAA
ncbi:3,4-dihydroxy-2-butanone 4-phosphate synthase [Azospirillum brasilense]|uniref:3,4-dihydroxy-2-butanone 4-phosphate synthase n=1 Tax=Azospirillum brasilense TaxID=192 RepID=A0A560CIX9_AZOBR|nr:3,4-dihydroxy-2-butanone-4-phosphate synthase [Azospirillum brasilense]MBK3733070.1 3,4-dihydroxy-2-butanone-4-phosphate synthase [Azospirillum brasilense]TWA84814.1 3,4-dihydroxy-2-butanone 4-phosphate synthase [Azospirillum brasilense]